MKSLQSILKMMTRSFAWVIAITMSVWLILPQPAAAAPIYKYEWKSQSGTISADGKAHEYQGVTAGQTFNLSLTLINRSGVTIKGTTALGEIPVSKQVQIGAWGIGTQKPQDGTPSFLDSSSFILNGNRFVYYNGADVPNGGEFTLSWTVKMSSILADGTYKLWARPVSEYLAWTRQYKNGITFKGSDSDIYWKFKVGSGTDQEQVQSLFVYLTSAKYDGNLGGRSGADAKCVAPSGLACKAGTTHALITVNKSDSITNMAQDYGFNVNLPIYWYNRSNQAKLILANNWNGMINLTGIINGQAAGTWKDEWSGDFPWTGGVSGGATDNQDTCNQWTSNAGSLEDGSGPYGGIGGTDPASFFSPDGWTGISFAMVCKNQRYLRCVCESN
jgi:hypothetical protein